MRLTHPWLSFSCPRLFPVCSDNNSAVGHTPRDIATSTLEGDRRRGQRDGSVLRECPIFEGGDSGIGSVLRECPV